MNLGRRFIVTIKKYLGIGVTFGEVAKANGDGPCQRCVGRALADMPRDSVHG
jgi:alkylated DNA nucleotide flippase Atl1